MGAGVVCRPAYCTHRYSSAQAWNADQTLLVIVNGCNGFCFLDGQTYAPVFRRAGGDECEWHPADPRLMICVRDRAVYAWAPRTDIRTTLFVPVDYDRLRFGPYKGNLSRDGRRLAVRAADRTGAEVVFGLDVSSGQKFPDIPLANLPGTPASCSISPSGLYILCFQHLPTGVEQTYVFALEGDLVQHWPEHHRPGHGDMTIDEDGSDVLIGISKSPPDKYRVIRRRLRDGAVTELAPYGEAQHASLRNTRQAGWVFVTYSGAYEEVAQHPHWAPFWQEVIALRTDGSGEFRRIVNTRAAPHGYWSEAHASPSPDGSQVIWSSNWGQPGGPVADYVTRISWRSTLSSRTAPASSGRTLELSEKQR